MTKALDRVTIQLARMHLRDFITENLMSYPPWTVMAAMSLELGCLCRIMIEAKDRSPDEIHKLVGLIEKLAFNPDNERPN